MCCEYCHVNLNSKNSITGYRLCKRCYNSHFIKCAYCGRLTYKANNFNNIGFCNSWCLDKFKREKCGFIGYYQKPNPIFGNISKKQDLTTRKNNLHVGIELEIQGKGKFSFCESLYKLYNNNIFYLKEDGSLNNTGVEIISHPMTYENIINSNHWKLLFDLLKENDMNNTENCGLHFHLDKIYFSNDNIKALDYIVHKSERILSQKGERTWGRYCENKTNGIYGVPNGNRYQALNLENENTLELRYCKSTDNYDNFIKKVTHIFKLVSLCTKFSFVTLDNMTETKLASLVNNET
jgi:hypothetical protein